MVRVCVFPGGEKKMKSYTPETFHRLPLQYNDRSLLEQWLIVLHMDIETPIKTRQKDDRVCSAHFDKDDFTIPKRAADPKNPKRVSLKRNAIPRVQQVATDRLESKDNSAEHTSFGEFGLDDPADDSFEPLSDTSPSSPGSCSFSTSSKGSGDSSADRRWLVDEAKLMELFKTCHQCGTAIKEQTTTRHGSKIKMNCLTLTCLQGHSGEWQSCPDQRNLCIVIGQGHHSAKDCTKAIGEIFCVNCVTQNLHFVFQECVRRRTSLLHHICGVHRWEEPGVEHTSHHAPLTEEEQRKKR
uniref:THAP domain-containing protein 1 n=1 Tax=Gadus morhua TaxID=8049 RepID=A0A8C5AIC9_GADMO